MTWQNQQSDCALSEDSDQPWHSPSLIRVFAVCRKKAWVLSYPLSAQRRLWSDWVDAQDDLSLRWADSRFVGFIMSRLIFQGLLEAEYKRWRQICEGNRSVPTVYEPRHDKTNKMSVCPAKTQISLNMRPVWSESSLCAHWVAKDPSFLRADSEDSDQTGRMPRLIWVFAGRTCHFVWFVMSWLIPFTKRWKLV